MRINFKGLAAAGVAGLAALAASPAFAGGTTAGTNISNTAIVNYSVSGTAQTPMESSSVAFTVDRKISMTVVEVGNATTTVAPGQTAAVTAFTVTNTSNDVLDLGLSFAEPVGGTAVHGGTDNFNTTGGGLFVDTNTNGVYNAGTDLAVTYLDEVAIDASRTVFYVANIPANAPNGGVAGVTLTATAQTAGTSGTAGAAYTETLIANTVGIDNVFADTATGIAGDSEGDGKQSGRDDYTVASAVLTVSKVSKVVSDPFNLTSNPKLIPGATVEYCIAVANAAGATTASGITITDVTPTGTTFVASSIKLNATVAGSGTNSTCAGGTAGGTYTGGTKTVSGGLGDIAGGAASGLIFQVTID